MKVGTSDPPAGMIPSGKPIAVPRNHGFHDRFKSLRDISARPFMGMIFQPVSLNRLAM